MSEHLKIRVVVEEVVVDLDVSFQGLYRQYNLVELQALLKETVATALKAHEARKILP